MLSSLQSLGTVQVQASTLPCGSTPTSIGRTCRKRVCWPFRSPRNLRIGPIIGLGALGSGSPVGGHGIYLRKSLEARQCQPCQDQGGNEVRAEIPGGVHACLRVGLGPGGCSGLRWDDSRRADLLQPRRNGHRPVRVRVDGGVDGTCFHVAPRWATLATTHAMSTDMRTVGVFSRLI